MMNSRFCVLLLWAWSARCVLAWDVAMERKSDSSSAREVMELFEIDESVLRVVQDGRDLVAEEREPLYRLLYVLPRFDELQRSRWSTKTVDWARIAADPLSHRLTFFDVLGKVVSVTRQSLTPEAARRFQYDHFYVVELKSILDNRRLVVCSRQIPRNWPADPTGQPVSCQAMFLKTGEAPSLLFASDRLSWHPNRTDDAGIVSPGAALLGQTGMDVDRLADVKQKQPLGSADRECFYQMLWAVRRMDPAAIERVVRDTQLPVVRALEHPGREAGKAYRLHGTARRATKILVRDTDIRQRFGIDHYYEIEFFTPLERPLRLVDQRDGETRSYQNYPVTVCSASLPKGMPEGDEIRQPIVVSGFFMKLWSYRSLFASGSPRGAPILPRRQVSPLLIAQRLDLDKATVTPNHWPAWLMAIILVGGVALAFVVRWCYARGDRPLDQWRKSHQPGGPIAVPEFRPPNRES